jgi:hypothetical protein
MLAIDRQQESIEFGKTRKKKSLNSGLGGRVVAEQDCNNSGKAFRRLADMCTNYFNLEPYIQLILLVLHTSFRPAHRPLVFWSEKGRTVRRCAQAHRRPLDSHFIPCRIFREQCLRNGTTLRLNFHKMLS